MNLAVDVGGSSIKFAVIDENNKIIYRHSKETPDNSKNKITTLILEVAKEIRKDYDFKKIGIATAGVVDIEKTEIISASYTIKDYIGTNFKKEIGEKLNCDIFVDNDVNSALRGEIFCGSCMGLNEVFCVALGTGIGGAYYKDDIVTGSNYAFGELGRTLLYKNSEKTYEQVASTIALGKKIEEELQEKISVKEFFDKCKNNDKKSKKILNSWLDDLAFGLVNMMLILDPKYVVIGGAISKQGDYIIDLISKRVKKLMPIKTNKTKFLAASLDNDAALFGAISKF